MRAFTAYLLVYIGTFLPTTTAYGIRGAAERVLYYYAYLAEELYTMNGFTIAPGCGEAMAKPEDPLVDGIKRCNFNQFLEYIWKEQITLDGKGNPTTDTQDDQRPTVDMFKEGFDFKDEKIPKLITKLGTWESERGFGMTGNSDPGRVVEGAADYYDALSKVGLPISFAKARVADWDPRGLITGPKYKPALRLLKNAGYAANIVLELRIKDMDKFRIDTLNKRLGFRVETRPGENTLKVAQNYVVFDSTKTIEAYKDSRPTIKTDLEEAVDAWKNDPSRGFGNRNHYNAFRAAGLAVSDCAC